MSVTKTFDDWYDKLPSNQKSEVLSHVLNTKCNLVCEGFHAGPTGLMTKGLFVTPSGSTARVCAVCGK
jgi:hypothetical protein